ncbi:MAG: hypothetical protein RL722_2115 [Pseudomonadota bacterium]|jgi:hypothetical protein
MTSSAATGLPRSRAEVQAAYVDQTAALLGLGIAAEHHAGVVRYFGLAAEFAELVMGLPLAPEDEAGEQFIPVSPADGGSGPEA